MNPMPRRLAAAALLLTPIAAGAAIGYSRFAPPNGDYVLEHPADWKRTLGYQLVDLRPTGKAGSGLLVSLERHPVPPASPKTPKAYAERVLALVGTIKRLDAREPAKVDGRPAERLSLTETVVLKGEYGQPLPGPMKEVHLIIPIDPATYYVLKMQGVGKAYDQVLPEFERIVRRLHFGASKP